MVRINLHNHTRLSDGAGDAADIVSAAVEAGLSHVGISDHFRSTKLPPGQSLPLDRLAGYADEIRTLHLRQKGRIAVLAGLELSFSVLLTDLTFLGLGEPDKGPLAALDYLLFEYVNDAEWCGLGLEELLKIRPYLPVPVGLAHNDLARNFAGVVPPEALARILAQAHIFVELCPSRRYSLPVGDDQTSHLPYYRAANDYNRRFFAAARQEGTMFSIGCDVHADLLEVGRVDDASRFLAEHELEANAVTAHLWKRRS